jgi:hypothetical protein
MNKPENKNRIWMLWKRIVRWRGNLAIVSVALLTAQAGIGIFRANLTPLDRESWLNRRNRTDFAMDIEWNRLKKGDTVRQVHDLLGEPDAAGYWMGEAYHEDVYFLGPSDALDKNGILYIAYDKHRRLEYVPAAVSRRRTLLRLCSSRSWRACWTLGPSAVISAKTCCRRDSSSGWFRASGS